jgi:hypothetical protein
LAEGSHAKSFQYVTEEKIIEIHNEYLPIKLYQPATPVTDDE